MDEELSRKLDEFMSSVTNCLDSFDQRLSDGLDRVQLTAGCRIPPENSDLADNYIHPRDSHVRVAPGTASAAGSSDIQGDFAALKDSLARIKLPVELKLNESRQVVKRSDQPVLNVVSRCSRYSETTARLLSTIEPGQAVSQEILDNLFLVCHAQTRYLQDEYASVLVNSQFDSSTSRIFRALQENTSGLNSESLETLRSAATLSAASRPQRSSNTFQTQGRGRGRGGGYQRKDTFSGFSQRSFPQQRNNNSDNHAQTTSKDTYTIEV